MLNAPPIKADTVNLTKSAAAEVRRLIGNGSTAVVRVSVRGGGCGGFEYGLTLTCNTHPADEIIESHGVRVVVDPKSRLYLAGVVVDFQASLLENRFVFENPNAASTCGCGRSFATQ